MPYLSITTNVDVAGDAGAALMREGSRVMAAGTGKPEQYVMVRVKGGEGLIFSGSEEAAAYVEVKSIGYPSDGVKTLARTLTELVGKHLGVAGARVYIVFEDVKGGMWGNDGGTFG